MPHDPLLAIIPATTRGQIAVITSDGEVRGLEVVDLPCLPDIADSPSLKATVALRDFLHLPADVRVAGAVAFGSTATLVTEQGKAKRVVLEPGARQAISLEAKDRLVAAFTADDGADLVMVNSSGQLLRTAVDSVPVQGSGARGVAGMKLKDAKVIAAGSGDEESLVVTVAGSGASASSIKVTALAEFPKTGRDGVGVRCQKLLSAESGLIEAWIGRQPLASSPAGKPLPLPEVDDRRDASGSPAPAAKIVLGSAAPSPDEEAATLFS